MSIFKKAINMDKPHKNVMIKVEDVCLSFGERPILKNVSFVIDQPAVVAITGKSGAGKTTLLGIIGGMLRPDSGRVFFDGRDILTLGDFKRARFRNREIGFVFQFFNLLPDITSRQNIIYPAILNPHAGNIDELVDYLVDYLHLKTIINQYPATLSGGERQRVAVARALINNPKVVMADEPTGNLDEDAAKGIVSLFRNIKETKGITTIIATHDSRVVAGADIHFHIDDSGCHLVRNSLAGGKKYSASKKALATKKPFSETPAVKKTAASVSKKNDAAKKKSSAAKKPAKKTKR